MKAEDTWLAQGEYATFFERNRAGIQYCDTIKGVYYVSRRWTLKGPIPHGVTVEHTGLAGYADDSLYTAEGFKREPKQRTGGTHSKHGRGH